MLQVEVCFLCLPPGFPAVPLYLDHTSVVSRPSQNRACAIHAHGSSLGHSRASCALCDAIAFPPALHDGARTVFPRIARPCVVSFPPAALPAFFGTTRQSDSPCPLVPPLLLRLLKPSPIHGREHGVSRVAASSQCHACHGLRPRGAAAARPLAAAVVLASANLNTSPFPVCQLSGLYPFNLSAYGLHACGPTLEVRDYSPPSKDSLPGGWPCLTGAGFTPARQRDLARPHQEI